MLNCGSSSRWFCTCLAFWQFWFKRHWWFIYPCHTSTYSNRPTPVVIRNHVRRKYASNFGHIQLFKHICIVWTMSFKCVQSEREANIRVYLAFKLWILLYVWHLYICTLWRKKWLLNVRSWSYLGIYFVLSVCLGHVLVIMECFTEQVHIFYLDSTSGLGFPLYFEGPLVELLNLLQIPKFYS